MAVLNHWQVTSEFKLFRPGYQNPHLSLGPPGAALSPAPVRGRRAAARPPAPTRHIRPGAGSDIRNVRRRGAGAGLASLEALAGQRRRRAP